MEILAKIEYYTDDCQTGIYSRLRQKVKNDPESFLTRKYFDKAFNGPVSEP